MQAAVRSLTTTLNSTKRYKFKSPEAVVDHIVIGGGVVGLAIARALSHRFPEKTTILIERHTRAGEETSSRNSEVIHAGLYYPPNSLKTRLCLRGRQMLYAYCTEHGIPHRRLGKLVVGRNDQRKYIDAMHAKAQTLTAPPHWDHSTDPHVLPTEVLCGDAARERVPELAREVTSSLWSPSTGIIDSAALLSNLEKDIGDAGATIAYGTRAVRIDAATESTQGWIVQTTTSPEEGSNGHADATLRDVLNEVLPPSRHIPLYYARGIEHLIYPVDEASAAKGASFHSLGTHLTLDMEGNVRFGPDIDWLSVSEGAVRDEDAWEAHLSPDEERARSMHTAVSRWGAPMISLLGIESPGLTASLALAEMVVEDMLVGTGKQSI
ncbi:FAD dependent oxidoreductase-domain-containing protein [Lactarius quietus]|nr:FAD dependent oxidoreductase-domain-containing protein [Lactarius quietus]